jgi:3-dehydroquinate dehydratase-1
LKQIKIKDTIIGDGKVKICVPVSGESLSEFDTELGYASDSPCDIIELRYDYLTDADLATISTTESSANSISNLLGGSIKNLQGKLILFTYRTKQEGGFGADDDDEYYKINEKAIASGQIDMIDIEFTKKVELVKRLIALAYENDVKVIVSKHYFKKSLSKDEQIEMLKKMQETGADIVKLAVSVYDEAGAHDVISAAKEMYEKHAKIPFITIGMGEHGKITRHIEPFYGSAITFARGQKATAPGQLSVSELQLQRGFVAVDT